RGVMDAAHSWGSRAEIRSGDTQRPMPEDRNSQKTSSSWEAARRLVVDELERVDGGKMNLQLIANEENQDCAQCGKNEAGGMILFVCRPRKHMRNAAANDRPEDAEHD